MADLPGVQELIEQLKEQHALTKALLESRDEELRERDNEIAILKQQLAYLKDKLFGRSSEKFDHPDLFTPEETKKPGASPENTSGPEATEEAKEEAKPKKSRPIREAKLPDHLPVVMGAEVSPAEVLSNPDDYTRVGERHADRLEREPGWFYLRRTTYPIFTPKDGQHLPPLQAKAEPSLVPGSFWGSSLMAEVMVNKFDYSQPFERQSRFYRTRHGIDLAVSTMCDVQKNCAEQFGILTRMMEKDALAADYLQLDETFHRYLDRKLPKGSANGYYWVVRRDNGDVLFIWKTGRDGKDIEDWLVNGGFQGVLQSDGYPVYLRIVARLRTLGKKIDHAACMAHIRRKFKEALGQHAGIVKWMLKHITRLYEIEADLKEHRASHEARARIRKAQSAPILRLLKRAMLHLRQKCPKILPKSSLGKALDYALGQWAGVQAYLEHGKVAIDNNPVERDIRTTAVGKKNHMFIGHPEAGQRSAVMYTLIISARNHGADPYAYLKDLIERLPLCKANDQASLRALLPANWAAASKARQAREAVAPATTAA